MSYGLEVIVLQPNITTLENLFLALSDKTRLRLLALMADGEVSVGYLADQLGESQPKISRHLAYLRGAGLVSTRRDGKWVYYGIETQADAGAEDVLSTAISAIRTPYNGSRSARARDHTAYDNEGAHDISGEPYTNDWLPAEIDIFLL